jgi:protein-S-isoprenylcysteine O-methyltransferase Ste14
VSFGGIAITDLLYGLTEFKKFKDAHTFRSFFPIVIVFLNLLAFGAGAGPIPWFLVLEMLQDAARASATSFISSLNWVFAFGIVRLFPYLRKGIGLGGSFMLSTAASAIATVFGIFYIKSKAQLEEKDLLTQTDPLYTTDQT